MAKTPFDDYMKEIELQRQIWCRKPALRILYRHWFGKIARSFADLEPVVEIGSGCGNFKEFYPQCIATDVVAGGPWIDRVMDAQNLSFGPQEVGNFVAIDCIHHLQRPLEFLRQAARALKPGGRLILCEPAATPAARMVYRKHHEPLDMNWDLFGLDGRPPEADPGHTFANMAIGELLFWRHRQRTLQAVPDLRLVKAWKFAFLLYPLTGGYNYRSMVPATGLRLALSLEDFLLWPLANWLTGLRMIVVLEKSATKPGATAWRVAVGGAA